MLINDLETKNLYENLQGFEGYIQLSGKSFEEYKAQSWEDLHENNNFILEAHFYNEDKKECILIKQINNEYKSIKFTLKDEDLEDINIYQSKLNKNFKVATIWEAKEDENCLNLKVLKPSRQLFVGFEKGDK